MAQHWGREPRPGRPAGSARECRACPASTPLGALVCPLAQPTSCHCHWMVASLPAAVLQGNASTRQRHMAFASPLCSPSSSPTRCFVSAGCRQGAAATWGLSSVHGMLIWSKVPLEPSAIRTRGSRTGAGWLQGSALYQACPQLSFRFRLAAALLGRGFHGTKTMKSASH